MTGERSGRRIWFVGGAIAVFVLVLGYMLSTGASTEEPPPTTTVPPNSTFAGCLECHTDPDDHLGEGASVILIFNHADHAIASDAVGCGSCHPVETHVATQVIRPSMDTCFNCHGVDAEAPLDCASCHPLSVVPRPPSHADDSWARAHGIDVITDESECATCHSPVNFCAACHGLEMPHPVGWVGTDHAFAYFEGPDGGCSLCHQTEPGTDRRTDCDQCHHPGGDLDQTWVSSHPSVVKGEGGGSCFACHDPSTCSSCHINGVKDLSADWARLREAEQ